jgi:hypothetical protein
MKKLFSVPIKMTVRTNEKNILLVNFAVKQGIKFSESPNAFDIFDCNNNARQTASKCSGKTQTKQKGEEASCINGGRGQMAQTARRKFMLQEMPCLNICTEKEWKHTEGEL